MQDRYTISITRGAPTNVEFIIPHLVESTNEARLTLVLEHVSPGCDIHIALTQSETNSWVASIPFFEQFTENQYSFHLNATGVNISPVSGIVVIGNNKIVVSEAVNSGIDTIGAPDSQVGTDPLEPEFPIDNDDEGDERSHSTMPVTPGENASEHIDTDELDPEHTDSGGEEGDSSTTIDDIASHVSSAAGPQLQTYEPELDRDPEAEAESTFDPKDTAQKIIRQLLPTVKLSTESTARLLSDTDRKKILKDPELMAELEAKARKAREILG